MEKRILKEKVPEGGIVNLGVAYSLRGQMANEELERMG